LALSNISMNLSIKKVFFLCLIMLKMNIVFVHSQGLSQKQANQVFCISDEMYSHLLQTDSIFQNIHRGIERAYNETVTKNRSIERSLPSYTLPVVVHLIVPPGTPVGYGNNLTDDEVEAGLNLLNQAFANQGVFQTSQGVDVGIRFCLARRDPQGKPTCGITRQESKLVAETSACDSLGTNADNDATIKQLVNWDCSQYINIWLVTDLFNRNLGCSLAGYAYFPGSPCRIDGIVQESRYWMTEKGVQVTAHEMGHYLNLFHTFQGGCTNTNCRTDGDRVCDTPPDGSPSYAACNTNSCSTDSPDVPDDNTNYMDYTSCSPLHFTEGQRIRMLAGLEIGRSSLITSQGCIPVAKWDVAVSIQNSLNCPTQICPVVTLKNKGLNTVNELSISWKIGEWANQSYNWQGTLLPDGIVKVTLPCQSVPAGIYSLSVVVNGLNRNPDEYPVNNTARLDKLKIAPLVASFTTLIGSGFTRIFQSKSFGANTYLWDFGDGIKSTLPNPTHIYTKEGTYTVKLIASNGCGGNQTIEQSIIVSNCTPGWRGFVGSLNNYQEPDESNCDMIKNGVLHIPRTLSNLSYYWTIFSFCDTICVGKNFTLQVRLKNSSRDGGIDAYDTGIEIKGEDGSAGVTLMGAAWAQSFNSIWVGNTRLSNRPELVLNLADWKTIELKVQNDTAYYQYEGANFFKMPFSGQVCNIRQIALNFKGSGMVDWIKVLDGQGTLAYEEQFDNCMKMAKPSSCKKKPLTAQVNTNFSCAKNQIIVTPSGGNLPYVFTLEPIVKGISDDGKGIYENLPPGKYNVRVSTNCPAEETNVVFSVPERLRDSLLFQQAVRCNANGRVGLSAVGGIPPYAFRLNKGNWQAEGIFENLSVGRYDAEIEDSNGCIRQRSIIIENLKIPLQLNIDSLHRFLNCRDTTDRGWVLGRASGNVPPYFYSLNDSPSQPNGLFRQLFPGSYKLIVSDEGGCTSSPIYFSVLKQSGPVFTQTHTLCAGEGLKVGNKTYTTTGIYRDTLKTIAGCDSVVTTNLTIRTRSSFTQTRTLCAGESLKIGNKTYTTTGIYRDTLKTIAGCDSVVTTNLTIRTRSSFTQTRTLCAGESLKIGNKTYTTTGIYRDTLKTIAGCDSVVTTNLTIRTRSSFNQTHAVCAGESLKIGNKTYTTTGIYRDTLKTITGCDSVVTTNLTIRTRSSFTQTHTVCAGEGLKVGNKIYTTTGIHRDTLKTIAGCDSVVTTNLTIRSRSSFNQARILCAGESLKIGNKTYTTTGIYRDTLKTIAGCDSVVTTNLTIRTRSSFTQTRTLCAGESLKVGNKIYTTTGIHRDTLKTIAGCDSVVTTNLTIRSRSSFTQRRTMCAGESLKVSNRIYTKTGIYKDTLKTIAGCDSIVMTHLTVGDTVLVFRNSLLCEKDTFRLGKHVFTNLGTHIIREKTWIGCDSTIVLRLAKYALPHCDSLYCRMYVPNIFAPDSNDSNASFTVSSPVVKINSLSIYDRWGNRVYHYDGVGEARWDGLSTNGQKVAPGVYIYMLQGECAEGRAFHKAGDITLLR
jgi:PKD repeat protein